jgi:hypothetical protein
MAANRHSRSGTSLLQRSFFWGGEKRAVCFCRGAVGACLWIQDWRGAAAPCKSGTTLGDDLQLGSCQWVRRRVAR